MKKKKKKILVDMSASILHHGHIRLLKKASKLGKVYVALTSDKEILKKKKVSPLLDFKSRKEIISSIKYVSGVLKCNYDINNKFFKRHKFDFLIHGSDNKNSLDKKYVIIFKRTKNVSASLLRKKSIIRLE